MSLLSRQQRRRGRQYSKLSLILIGIILSSGCSYQQDENGDGYDDEDSYDDTDDTDDCSLISGHTCNANGICKYCAMCLQSSCILSKSISPIINNTSNASPSAPVCNTTQFGSYDIYDWYGYCLSSGNDSDGDYCATSSECYQYRKNANSSISYIWKNLTCEPTSCLLMTDRGQPPPAPGQLPPDSDSSNDTAGGGGGGGGHRHHSNDSNFSEHSPSTIALTVTCSFIFLAGLIWITRLWMQSRKRRGSRRPLFSWFTLCGRRKQQRVQSLASDTTTIPSTAPPSFSSNAAQPEMQQRRNISNTSLAGSQSSQQQQHQRREPLPSYYSPDPPPPKYEQAIVTQIRGLMARDELDDSVDNNETGPATTAGHNSLPPPLWLPVYFTPNHSAYSFGRLRRHPPPHMASPSSPSASSSATPIMRSNSNNNNGITSGASSSSNPYHHDLWNHHNNTNWSDPLQAFWYHHQQQIGQPRPSPSTSSPAAMDISATNNRRNNNQSTDHESNSDNGSNHQVNNSTSSTTGLQ